MRDRARPADAGRDPTAALGVVGREQDHVEAVHALVGAIADVLRLAEGVRAEPEPWIDVAAAAAYASCGEDAIRELIRRGELPCGRIGDRGIRVRRSDVDRALVGARAPEASESAKVAVDRILRSLDGNNNKLE